MKDKIVTEISKPQTKNEGNKISDRDGSVDTGLCTWFDFVKCRNEISLNGNHCHGNGVMKNDHPALAFRRL